MKTVLLLRHAKSDWKASFDRDLERPLAKRGQKAAAVLGRFLDVTGQVPDRVYTSPAVRAHDTVTRAAKAGGWTCPVEVTPDLYDATPDEVLSFLRHADDHAATVLLAGHEPTWSDFAGLLIGDAHVRFPTSAIARIEFGASSWRKVSFGRGRLVWFLPPRLLKAMGWTGEPAAE